MASIVLYGGTFNPVHRGHTQLCRYLLSLGEFDRIVVMPAAAPPHKDAPELAAGHHRLAMLQLAFAGLPQVEISDWEIGRGGRSYTVDTIAYLREQYPQDRLFLLMGSDMYLTFCQWKSWQEIGKNAMLLVASRQNDQRQVLEEQQKKLTEQGIASRIIYNTVLEASSTQIRHDLQENKDTELLEPAVLDYCKENILYTKKAADFTNVYDLAQLRAQIRPRMDDSRYHHSLCVEQRAVELAHLYGAKENQAAAAGILHDICKQMDQQSLLQIMADCGTIGDIDFLEQPQLLHSYAGAEYLRRTLGITDQDLLNAVRYHTTGRAGMSLLEQIIYLADLTSAERDYPDVEQLRQITNRSLEAGMHYALTYMVEEHLPHRGLSVCAATQDALAEYKQKEKAFMEVTPLQLVEKIVKILDSKQAADIAVMNIKDLTTIGDYFVVASGNSNTQVKALAEEVEDGLSKAGIEPKRVEGQSTALWVLMDYYDVVVHIFYKETREFYSIERLWNDAPRLDVDELLKA